MPGGPWPPGRHAARIASALLLAGTTLALPVRAPEAQETSAQRPRIGLALSGGGARGAAHIGVLKVLESMHVPVDCIAGTSMGAVVGGAYAAGTQPADMEQLIANTDWADVFTDRPPRGEISIRRKEDDYKGFFAPEFGVRDGAILLPKGVVAGVTIEGFLRQLSTPAAGMSDFDRLPIPFRAVATDITTGEEVVLERGSLMRAMRASMAIPGALAPVEIEDRLLVDGGIANNLPIDVVRNLCAAEVVIAVNIGTPALTREQLGSALAIVGQLTSFLGKSVVDGQLASLTAHDVLIAPDLGDISAASFDRQKEAIAIGEAAAREMAGALASYAVSPARYAALREHRQSAALALGQVDEIRFEGIERTNAEVLRTLMASEPGTPLSEPEIDADLRRIYGRGDFESVDYRIERGPGRSALVIQVREKTIGPDYLRFGLALASDFDGQAYFNALASYRRTWLNRAGGEWLSELQIGKDNYLFSEFYQPFEHRGRFFAAPYVRISRSTEDIFVRGDRVAEYQVTESRAGVDLGATLGTWGEIRLGPMFRDVNARTSTGSPTLPDIDVNASGMRLRLFGDRYDFPWFPRSGHRTALSAFASLGSMGADQDYQRLEASWSGATSFGRHTFAATLHGGSNLGSDLPAYEAFVLGGPFRLSGYQINQFAGQNSAFASLRYYNQVYRLPSVLGSGIYVGGSLEAGRVGHLFDGRRSTGTLHSASLYLAAETFLGPLFFGVGLAGGGDHAVYLMLGAP